MDPLSALSVAAAVVQFVDFGFGLVKKASNIRKDAAVVREKIVEIERLSEELLDLSGQIQERMSRLRRPGGLLTMVEMRLLEACDNCQAMGEQIAEAIPKIQEKGVKSVTFGFSPPARKDLAVGALKDCKSIYSNFRNALQLVLAESLIGAFNPNAKTVPRVLEYDNF
ncbi:hypothetical protein QBC32DRAFT_315865 [Pseudoneurospora amorphoporcata]|uniref:Uncharacterized protein n=1 Tax=Pseudoneurospora amorphoporcata TaxID=241081 RepID=A0AAN6SEA0_9PEZI|nr:hypothetical protein QBC32DRAFT_315865 [Pseudoneurospora amorphoporcata]